jgi:protein SCO1/2
MNRRTTITLFYCGVALISAAILVTAFYLRSRIPKPNVAAIVNAGRESPGKWFEISRDLNAVNQEGKQVKLSDLRGKVWLVAEFFAVCPHCAERNGEELRKIYDEFGKHPDFHIACITVDPENDQREKLADYAKALGADTSNWWFLNAGDQKTTHEYLENVLKFMGVRERSDPLEIKAGGRFAHDLSFLLVDREFRVIGKWPLADARSEEARQRDPGLYQKLKDELFQRIRDELEKNESPGI